MYTFEAKIRYSECGVDAGLTTEALINYFQDATVFHSDSVGVGLDYMFSLGIGWIVNFWQIDVMRYPKEGEEVVIETNPYQLKGFSGLRNFRMKSKAGEELAVANSVWTLVDFIHANPTRITQDMYDAYDLGEAFPMEYLPRKIKLPKEQGIACDSITVSAYMLDTNHHMNNEKFVQIAKSVLPDSLEGKREKRIMVQYKKQAMLGDMLYPVRYDKEDMCTIAINDAAGDSYAIVELYF